MPKNECIHSCTTSTLCTLHLVVSHMEFRPLCPASRVFLSLSNYLGFEKLLVAIA